MDAKSFLRSTSLFPPSHPLSCRRALSTRGRSPSIVAGEKPLFISLRSLECSGGSMNSSHKPMNFTRSAYFGRCSSGMVSISMPVRRAEKRGSLSSDEAKCVREHRLYPGAHGDQRDGTLLEKATIIGYGFCKKPSTRIGFEAGASSGLEHGRRSCWWDDTLIYESMPDAESILLALLAPEVTVKNEAGSFKGIAPDACRSRRAAH